MPEVKLVYYAHDNQVVPDFTPHLNAQLQVTEPIISKHFLWHLNNMGKPEQAHH